jgi:hypothetical protein
MRFNLRLNGRTALGQSCRADVSVYANSQNDLQEQARKAAGTASWVASEPPHDPISEGSTITVESVERI